MHVESSDQARNQGGTGGAKFFRPPCKNVLDTV